MLKFDSEEEHEEIQVIDEIEELDYSEEVSSDKKISLRALNGEANHYTLQVRDMVKKKPLTILIGSGSTHSFIYLRAAEMLGCVLQPTAKLLVIVADGSKVINDAKCPILKWSMQGQEYIHEIRVLPLGGYDVVLGVDWMSKYNPVTFDFHNLKLYFHKDGKKVTIRGTSDQAMLQSITVKGFKKLVKKKSLVLIELLFSVQAETNKEVITDQVQGKIKPLLEEFQDVFQAPK